MSAPFIVVFNYIKSFLANDKIYKWKASVPPKEFSEWEFSSGNFNFMKFDINRMEPSTTTLKEKEDFSYAYFDGFSNDQYTPLTFKSKPTN